MKKLFLICAMLLGVLSLGSCSCNKESNQCELKKAQTLVVENIVSVDREYMYLNYGGDYRWFETCILLKNFLDEENNGEIAGISDVFQVISDEDDRGADVNVILISHTENADTVDVKHAFWVGDSPLNAEAILIPFEKAYELLQQVNLPKPHSRHCVLRKEVGPVDANPQYVFGNTQAQLYVDAVTGEVSEENPAFKGFGFKMPLGEWP